MEEENKWTGSIIEQMKINGDATTNVKTIITEEMIRNTIKEYLNSANDYQDVTVYYYCEGLGKVRATRWDRPYSCEHPKCDFCRGMEKALKREFDIHHSYTIAKLPEMPTTIKETIPNGFRKVNKGSKFTKKKRRNR